MQEAEDFLEESRALERLVASVEEPVLSTATLFKQWTINDILQHLHILNLAAYWALTDKAAFGRYATALLANKSRMRAFENEWLNGLRGSTLVAAWRDFFPIVASAFRKQDGKVRLDWFGPPMSARSAITARQMETWAHGQAIFDVLGVERHDADRIRNIAHLGVLTFGWSFAGRGLQPPGPAPQVILRAPSGEIWRWNDNAPGRVEGDATEFCQVVTQTRNIADTQLRLEGASAQTWMAIAQCFAGSAQKPPAPGARRRAAF
ncbi:MAG: TIGR03084 family protein [Hyphomonadaceae bacterium]|nr:TIGR03084 family protein [Hyphomonadaceae bacterium]